MAEIITGRDVKVEIALTFAAAVNPTAVTKANPAVVTLATHGIADGSAGYWTVSAGMVELDGQGVLVDNGSTNNFDLPGLDTTDYSTYTAGSLTIASTWGTLSEAASYTVGGGAPETQSGMVLLDKKQRNVITALAAQDMQFDVRSQVTHGAAMAALVSAAQRGLPILVKVSKGSTVLRVAYGTPSLPGENVQAGGLASGQFSLILPGWAVKPNV